jgi:UDP-glucose 4-epimerase
MGNKALVNGSGGYIGSRVVTDLRNRGYDVIGMDLASSETTNRIGDVRYSDDVYKAIYEVRPDVVVHLAYILTGETAADLQKGVRINIVGTNNVFDTAAFLKVPRVLFASSTSVYGDQNNYGHVYLDEETGGKAATIYGLMKQFGEQSGAHYQSISSTRFISLRISSLYGRGRTGGRFNPIGDIITAGECDDPIVIRVPSHHVATFIYVDEVAECFGILAECARPKYDVYNTGGVTLTMEELSEIAERVYGRSVICDENGDDFAHAGMCSWDRLRNEFGIERKDLEYYLALEKEYMKTR